MMRISYILLIIACFSFQVSAEVSYRLFPQPIILEKDDAGQYLNFDVLLKNKNKLNINITYIEFVIYDKNGRFVSKRSVSGNGLPGSLSTIPTREIKVDEEITIFNPFDIWPVDIPLYKGSLNIYFDNSDSISILIKPKVNSEVFSVTLPIKTTSFVEDGNDFYSHHRRVSLSDPVAIKLGIENLTQRYALDFTVIDQKGEYRSGERSKLSNWYAYGTKIYAPADGYVSSVRTNMSDSTMTKNGRIIKPDNYSEFGNDASTGNYIIIRHSENIYSMLAHFQFNSLKHKVGDKINKGQYLGVIGLSGDTAYPHLHFQLQAGININTSKPVVIIFDCVQRIGSGRKVKNARLKTGDLVSTCMP